MSRRTSLALRRSMLELLRSKRLGFWVACAIGLLGILLSCRRMSIVDVTASQTREQFQVVYLDSILILLGAAIVGVLAGLMVAAISHMVDWIDRADSDRILEAERWERFRCRFETLGASLHETREPENNPARQDVIDSIHRTIRSRDWTEATRLVESLQRTDGSEPDIDRLSQLIENGRRDDVETQLEQIRASKEVGDSERVLELYQEAARILDPNRRKSLEDDLARWFMSHIQRRLRSGTIQADVVTLTARVSEIFGGTTEGASLRAGLPTLRRTVGLCPRCGGPYVGVADACPECLSLAVS